MNHEEEEKAADEAKESEDLGEAEEEEVAAEAAKWAYPDSSQTKGIAQIDTLLRWLFSVHPHGVSRAHLLGLYPYYVGLLARRHRLLMLAFLRQRLTLMGAYQKDKLWYLRGVVPPLVAEIEALKAAADRQRKAMGGCAVCTAAGTFCETTR